MNGCLVCDRADLRPHYPGLVRCPSCGFVSADARLTDEQLRALYDDNYFRGGEYRDYLADEEELRRNFRRRLKTLRRHLDPRRHRHLLEIGSAYGFFLDEARPLFETVEGVEINESGAGYARERLGLPVFGGDFLRHDFAGRRFDVVCLWDTIEHLGAPDQFLRKIGALTEAGALLAITTGDIESLNARFRKERWRLIHPPTHLHYFSPETLGRLLRREGFEIISQSYCGVFRNLRSIVHGLRPGFAEPAGRIRGLLNFSVYLNLYDIMYIIAQKR